MIADAGLSLEAYRALFRQEVDCAHDHSDACDRLVGAWSALSAVWKTINAGLHHVAAQLAAAESVFMKRFAGRWRRVGAGKSVQALDNVGTGAVRGSPH